MIQRMAQQLPAVAAGQVEYPNSKKKCWEKVTARLAVAKSGLPLCAKTRHAAVP
ncbi:hypothetical protein ACFSKU_03450 [Pontibacter silvestris]|uniref:Uncharacterized protein n=1 Tax=Pontibacter silvestris TaxID=2305183 RepID=A0ABW4WU34_9BACT|nr:hypothetical protein [Pontibacter silvestris]MCC9138980.1 hypothetical protein [Pontibacter silvestris]